MKKNKKIYHNLTKSMLRSTIEKKSINAVYPMASLNNPSKRKVLRKLKVNHGQLMNMQKLNTIASLQDNWNYNNAKAFSKTLISKVRTIITFLDVQPEIFPTACNSLQLEYDKNNGAHMEIEIWENKDAEVFVVKDNGEEHLFTVKANVEQINQLVNKFYGFKQKKNNTVVNSQQRIGKPVYNQKLIGKPVYNRKPLGKPAHNQKKNNKAVNKLYE